MLSGNVLISRETIYAAEAAMMAASTAATVSLAAKTIAPSKATT